MKIKLNEMENILNILGNYDISDFDNLSGELCDTLIEWIEIGEFIGRDIKMREAREIEVYLFGIGKISDLVDVSFIPFSQRVKAVMPQLIVERRCKIQTIAKILNVNPASLMTVIYKENTTLNALKDEVRRMMYIEAILQGKTQKALWNAIGFNTNQAAENFVKRIFGLNYYQVRKKILNGEIK